MSLDPRYLHERDLDNPHLDAYTLARVVEQRPDLAEKARKHPNFDAAYLYPTGQHSSTARPNARHDEQAFQTRYLTRADMSDPDLDAMALNQIIRERPDLASLAQQHPNFREPTWNEQRLPDQRYPSPEHTGTEQAETGQNSQGYSYGDTTADEAKVWLILLHIGTVVLSIIGPAIAWLVKKESPIIVAQARACLNWSISVMIYRMVLGAFGLLLLPAARCCGTSTWHSRLSAPYRR